MACCCVGDYRFKPLILFVVGEGLRLTPLPVLPEATPADLPIKKTVLPQPEQQQDGQVCRWLIRELITNQRRSADQCT